MTLPTKVKIVEVGPRDGLQNESQTIPKDIKIEFINQLSETGLSHIEVTSFVSPKKIPQIADNAEIFTKIRKNGNVTYSALVPNMQGLERALEAGVKEIAIFTSASETFCYKNIDCSINESLQRFEEVLKQTKQESIRVRGYVSCALGCPYQGEIKPQQVQVIAKRLYEMGCFEISLADTIGVGTPYKAQALIEETQKAVPIDHLAVHFHDTYGQAIANIFAALHMGISIIDCSVAGLGGCPYAKGATGNVASEDVIYLLEGLNIFTGIDLVKLSKAGIFISNKLNRCTQSKVAKALAAKNFEI